jgi:hexosaminidase
VAEVLEPVKEYQRGQTAKYTQFTPLNRVIDAIPPESIVARNYAERVKQVTSKTAAPADQAWLRDTLTRWRDNDQKFTAVKYDSFLTKDVTPVSAQLSRIGTLGLESLDALASGRQVSDCDAKLSFLKQAAQATPDMLNQVAAPTAELVNAACGK